MKNLVEELNQHFASFIKDATLHVENGNKAAGTRARKTSLAIEKALKDFRKQSIEASKI
ncbi:MAG: histone H1 [Candidatus Azobacteroides sp.]|nr:histone H1 [Candidatus Azobacteroides sp.]